MSVVPQTEIMINVNEHKSPCQKSYLDSKNKIADGGVKAQTEVSRSEPAPALRLAPLDSSPAVKLEEKIENRLLIKVKQEDTVADWLKKDFPPGLQLPYSEHQDGENKKRKEQQLANASFAKRPKLVPSELSIACLFKETGHTDHKDSKPNYVKVGERVDTSCCRTLWILISGVVYQFKFFCYITQMFMHVLKGDRFMQTERQSPEGTQLPRLVEPIPAYSYIPASWRCKPPLLPKESDVSEQLYRVKGDTRYIDANISVMQPLFAQYVINVWVGSSPIQLNSRGSFLVDTFRNNQYGLLDSRRKALRLGKGGKVRLNEMNVCIYDKLSKKYLVGDGIEGNVNVDRVATYSIIYREHNRVAEALLASNPTPKLDPKVNAEVIAGFGPDKWAKMTEEERHEAFLDENIFRRAAQQLFYCIGQAFLLDYAPNYFGIYAIGMRVASRIVVGTMRVFSSTSCTRMLLGLFIKLWHGGPWWPLVREIKIWYRFHSLQPDNTVDGLSLSERIDSTRSLPEIITSEEHFEWWISSQLHQPAGSMGPCGTPKVLNNPRFDIDALTLWRSRQHGIATVGKLRSSCWVPRPFFWHQLSPDKEVQRRLKELYRTPSNVELHPAVNLSGRTIGNPETGDGATAPPGMSNTGLLGIDGHCNVLFFIFNAFLCNADLMIPKNTNDNKIAFQSKELPKRKRGMTINALIQRSLPGITIEQNFPVTRTRSYSAPFATYFGKVVWFTLNLLHGLNILMVFLVVGIVVGIKQILAPLGLHSALIIVLQLCIYLISFVFFLF